MEHLSLFKQERSGRWFIQYETADGIRKQRSTRCTNKADALRVFADFKSFLREVRTQKPVPFAAFSKDFLSYARVNYAPKTVLIYEAMLAHFKRICGDLLLSKITAWHWDKYKATRLIEKVSLRHEFKTPEEAALALQKQHTLSPISVHIELRTLRAVMNTAVRWQYIPKNPFEKLPLIPIPKSTPTFLTTENAQTLLSHITDEWFRDFVIFAINTGMRRGEILALRQIDIDTEHRVARITNRKEFKAKSGEQRIVSLNDAALSTLERRRKGDGQEFAFTDDEGRRLLKDRVTHAFKKAIRAAGLDEALHLHSTRHSFASLLVGSGTSLFTVSKLLGHTSTKTSEIYSHLLPQHLQKEVSKITIGAGPQHHSNTLDER